MFVQSNMKQAGKLVKLIHNPGAGEGNYSKEEIIKIMEMHGYRCSYVSSKKLKSFKDVDPETEFIAIAGGDGTIRKAIMNLLNKKIKFNRPIALLPFGTANNIADSLGIQEDISKNISSWDNYKLHKFDVGQVIGLKRTEYFIESLGFGLIPKLIKIVKRTKPDHLKTAEEEFEFAIAQLLKITQSYIANPCTIEIDDKSIEIDCLMLEVMNISRLGPELSFSKNANPGDGFLDVVIVPAEKRKEIEKYIQDITKGKKVSFPIRPILAKKISINWKGEDLHIDDQIGFKAKTFSIQISILMNLLEVIVNKE